MRTVPLIVIGRGKVAKAFAARLSRYARRRPPSDIRFQVVATLHRSGIILADGRKARRRPGDWSEVTALARAATSPVFVDLSDADALEGHLEWVHSGFTVVTANKRPLAGSYEAFRRLTDALDPRGHRAYWFEATVGAGLPVVRTVRELVETGTRCIAIEAVVSGTLNALCEAHAAGTPFGLAVLTAMRMGFTEPDPRQDLLAEDVARKALILARLLGKPFEREQVRVQTLLPEEMASLGNEAFLKRLEKCREWPEIWRAPKRLLPLEYVVRVGSERDDADARLRPREKDLPALDGPENRYVISPYDDPLMPSTVIAGPGAGAEVTATAVFGDLLRSLARL
jgi:homoserine dehydrogenase